MGYIQQAHTDNDVWRAVEAQILMVVSVPALAPDCQTMGTRLWPHNMRPCPLRDEVVALKTSSRTKTQMTPIPSSYSSMSVSS